MSDTLVQIDGAPRPPMDPREIMRIAVNLAVVCALSAVVLGGVFMGTERYQKAANLARERRAVIDMLALGSDARVLEVRQFLAPEKREVAPMSKPCSCAMMRSTGPPGANCTMTKEINMMPRIVGIISSTRRAI